MKIAILDPASGIAGDMFIGALVDNGLDRAWLERLPSTLGLDAVGVRISDVQRSGVRCVKVDFEIPVQPHGRPVSEIHRLIDAVKIDCDLPQKPIIHGDALSASIAAASILAKVERDRIMCEWDAVFPAYGLASHKGYSTPKHLAALRELGPTPLHRQSFAPVWQNPVPQEAFAFMDDEIAEIADAGELVPEDLAG